MYKLMTNSNLNNMTVSLASCEIRLLKDLYEMRIHRLTTHLFNTELTELKKNEEENTFFLNLEMKHVANQNFIYLV